MASVSLVLLLADCGTPPAATAVTATAGIRRTLVQRSPAHEPGWETRLYLIEYPPGASAPAHVHPVNGVGFVIEGAFESRFDGEPMQRVEAGSGFVDRAEVPHLLFRNVSSEHVLRFMIAYTIRTEDEAVTPLNRQ